MAISTDWTIYVFNNSTLVWDSDYALARPNESSTLPLLHNQVKFQLADGSYAFITPETRSTREDVTFIWYYKNIAFKNQLEGYLNDHDYLKITTHNSIEFIGRFIAISADWLAGQTNPSDGTDLYNINAQFAVME